MMIAEKSQTIQLLTDYLTANAGKVSFIKDDYINKALSYLEKNGIPT
jgi:hypothetical protein